MNKKIWGWIIGAAAIAAIAIYVVLNESNSMSVTTTGSGSTPASTPSPTTSTTTGGANPPSSSGSGGNPAPTPTPTGAYKDGTYTGPVADAIYGNLQLVVAIQGGKIASVTWAVYPNSPGHTTEVSQFSLPRLEQEAIAAQSANVDIVSGATQTSEAFRQSLAAALAQAKA